MYIMSWVGIATTIGLVIEVPILLRSLADSLADVNLDHLPLGFHPSLLAALDGGVATECPSCLVDSYACDWGRHNRELAVGRFWVQAPWMSASIAIGNISLPLQSVIHRLSLA